MYVFHRIPAFKRNFFYNFDNHVNCHYYDVTPFYSYTIHSVRTGTALVSAQRLSKIKFNKLLMAHQDSPLLERARETVEKLVSDSIQKIRK